MKNELNILKKIGFKEIGCWTISNKDSDRINYVIDDEYLSEKDLLYSFVCDEIVYYIGKTDSTLKSRMTNYKAGKLNGSAGSTNKYVHDKILNLIKNDKKVIIYILLDCEKLKYHGINISLASGLELNLIKSFNTEELWNSRGSSTNKKDKKLHLNIDSKKISNEFTNDSNSNKIFELILRKEYYNKGIIQIPIRFQNDIPKSGGIPISLIIESKEPFYPTITISKQNRKINGKAELIDWYQNNFKLNDKVNVEIISETEFRVFK